MSVTGVTQADIEWRTRQATKQAKEKNEPIAVITLHEPPDRRCVLTSSLKYLKSGEFEAFEGQVIFIVQPNGEVEDATIAWY